MTLFSSTIIAHQQPKELICYPFRQMCADYFKMSDHHHLSIVDQSIGWLNIYYYPPHKTIADTLISTFCAMFISYGIPEELSTDRGPQFISTAFQNFLTKWGVMHRLSSVAYPQSNSRAELGVKTAKRIVNDNVGDSTNGTQIKQN